MKPLNRPMFRYGGPIKEGIMHGMQDGGLANNEGPRRAALVGNPIYDQTKGPDGRTKHIFPFILPALATAGRVALTRGIPMALRAFGKTGRTGLGRTKLTSPNILGRDPLLGLIPKTIQAGMGKTSKGYLGKAAKLVASPSGALLTAGTLTDILPGGKPFGPDKYLPNILGQRFDEQGNKIPGTGFFNPDKVEKGETEGMKRVETIGAGEGSTGGGVTDDPDKAKQIQEDRIEKTKKRYYELMGLDKMKKGAVYDSLIDASNIIQQQGGDLKGAVRSGTLQSSIINAISKNLDKSADIKRQIDAAVLKGEIQKDIASADSVDKDLKKARIKQLERAEKNASASGQIAAVRSEKGFVPGGTTAAILRNDGIAYDTILQDKLITDFKEDNPTKDEVDYIISLGTELPNGRYVVGERLVEKKGNEVAFIV